MYNVTVRSAGVYAFDVTEGNQTCHVSVNPDTITPPGMLLGGLGSCIGVYLRKYAEGARIDLGEFDITVTAAFTKEPPLRFDAIDVRVTLHGAPIDDRRKAALLSFIRNCPVHNTIAGHPAITIAVT